MPIAKAARAKKLNVKLTQRGRDRPYLTADQIRAANRVQQLGRIFRDQFPKGLPHNGLGVKYSKYMIRTMAFLPDDRRGRWLERHAPWMDPKTRDYLLRLGPHWYSPRSLGESLELYDVDRERLRAWTIKAVNVSDEERLMFNREKDRKAKEARRRKDGATPRERSLSRTKPWEAEGISRSTWERRRRKARDANSSGPLLVYTPEDEFASPCQPQGTSITSTPSEPSRRELPPREIIIVPPSARQPPPLCGFRPWARLVSTPTKQ